MFLSLRLSVVLVSVSFLAWLPASEADACRWCRWHGQHHASSGGSYDRPETSGGSFDGDGEGDGSRNLGGKFPASQEALNRAMEQALGRAMQSRQFDSRAQQSRAMSRAEAIESRAAGIELGLALAQLILSQGGGPGEGLLGGFPPEVPPQAPPTSDSSEVKALRKEISKLSDDVEALVGAFAEQSKHSKALREDVDRLLEKAEMERSAPEAEGDQDATPKIQPRQ